MEDNILVFFALLRRNGFCMVKRMTMRLLVVILTPFLLMGAVGCSWSAGVSPATGHEGVPARLHCVVICHGGVLWFNVIVGLHLKFTNYQLLIF